nr:Chain P, CYTOTOXIC T-LYMPHOCYTE PROTEIN 4 [Homo sapiens]
TTGVYVKMPPT